MSLDGPLATNVSPDLDKMLDDEYERGYDAGYANGYSDGEIEGGAQYDGEYDRGYDNGVEEGFREGRHDRVVEFADLISAIREIENDMYWSLQDGSLDDHTSVVARVKLWHERIRTELEDAPL